MAFEFVRRLEAPYLVLLFLLLAGAAVFFIGTRPAHLEEGDFLSREDRRVVDEWLIGRLSSPVAESRERVATSLLRIGDPAHGERLAALLEDPAPRVRARAAFGLGVLFRKGRVPEVVREALIRALDDDERVVVQYAVSSLGRIEQGRDDLAPRLLATAAPVDVTATALRRMRAGDAADWFVDRLDSDDPLVRWGAALAVGDLLQPLPEGALPGLRKLGRDKNRWIRLAAARALLRGYPDRQFAGDVADRVGDADPLVRLMALDALARDREVLEPEWVVPLVADRNPNVAAAARALASDLGVEGLPPAPERSPQQRPADAPELPALTERDTQRIARVTGAGVLVETTAGSFELELDFENAPLTTWRFMEYARAGAWNGLSFAVEPGKLAEFGAGVPLVASEYSPEPFSRGSVGVRAAEDGEAYAVFVCLAPQPLFDGEYTNLGRLRTGDPLLDELTDGTRILSMTEIDRPKRKTGITIE